MKVIVVVDGGGTKTDVAIVDLGGKLVARQRFGSFIPQAVGAETARRALDAGVRQLLESVGDPEVVCAGVYFSGLDFPFEAEEFRREVSTCDWASQRLIVDNDTFALLRMGTTRLPAVAVVCGTGMNCVGRGKDGKVARFAALGDISGDWGGGASLGTAAMWHAARAADGRGPSTQLEALVTSAFGKRSMDEVILGFHRGELERSAIAGLAPVVFQAADRGDAVAAGIVRRQAEEIVALAIAAMRQLGVVGQACPVVLGGGVAAARHRLLLDEVHKGLLAKLPQATLVVVSDPPVLGAALLAFDELGAKPETVARLRQSFLS